MVSLTSKKGEKGLACNTTKGRKDINTGINKNRAPGAVKICSSSARASLILRTAPGTYSIRLADRGGKVTSSV